MRLALVILVGIHGIIHLFGFLRAYRIEEFGVMTQPISKVHGIFWLLTFVLFALTCILALLHSDYWWLFGFLALVVSQVLIIGYWSDAKFGTIANIMIFLATCIGFANFQFGNKVKCERVELFNRAQNIDGNIVMSASISGLPPIIQKWLTRSGVVGKPAVSNVHLVQELKLKMQPEQTEWNNGTAEQYFTIDPPGFSWSINAQLNPVMKVAGRDKFVNGMGEMTIKLFSLIPVADMKDSEKVDQATLQRYLAEIVWFPTASLSPHITWEQMDSNSAMATMRVNGTQGTGIFYFSEGGEFLKFTAMRFKDKVDKEPKLWTVTATRSERQNGIIIPVEVKADWELETGKWNWLVLKIKHIDYDVEKMPVARGGHK